MRAIPAVFLSQLVLLVACGAPALALGAAHIVRIEGMAFVPAVLSVKPGDTVVWENQDVVPHTATAVKPAVTAATKAATDAAAADAKTGFDSKLIAAGARWSWSASQEGRHDYVCTFHRGMNATVVVAR